MKIGAGFYLSTGIRRGRFKFFVNVVANWVMMRQCRAAGQFQLFINVAAA